MRSRSLHDRLGHDWGGAVLVHLGGPLSRARLHQNGQLGWTDRAVVGDDFGTDVAHRVRRSDGGVVDVLQEDVNVSLTLPSSDDVHGAVGEIEVEDLPAAAGLAALPSERLQQIIRRTVLVELRNPLGRARLH